MSKHRTTFSSLVICDDIREEKSNKLLFIGVYSGPIIVKKKSVTIRLSLWMSGTSNEDEVPVEVRTVLKTEAGETKEVLPATPLVVSVNKYGKSPSGEFFLVLKGFPVNIDEKATLTVQAREQGQSRWKVVGVKPIVLAA